MNAFNQDDPVGKCWQLTSFLLVHKIQFANESKQSDIRTTDRKTGHYEITNERKTK